MIRSTDETTYHTRTKNKTLASHMRINYAYFRAHN